MRAEPYTSFRWSIVKPGPKLLSCCNQLQHPLKIKLTNHIQRWRMTIAVVLALVLLIFQVITNFSKVKATEIGKYTFNTHSKTIPYAFLER